MELDATSATAASAVTAGLGPSAGDAGAADATGAGAAASAATSSGSATCAPILRTSAAARHMNDLMAQMLAQNLFDSLRPHLQEEAIFKDHEDPETTHIRLDMLKSLASKWKLGNQPGFWQAHTTRVSLARALHRHVRLVMQPKARYKAKAELGAEGSSRKPSKPQNVDLRSVLPAYAGDVFGTNGDYSDSLVYLSRYVRPQLRSKFNTIDVSRIRAPPKPAESEVSSMSSLGTGSSGQESGEEEEAHSVITHADQLDTKTLDVLEHSDTGGRSPSSAARSRTSLAAEAPTAAEPATAADAEADHDVDEAVRNNVEQIFGSQLAKSNRRSSLPEEHEPDDSNSSGSMLQSTGALSLSIAYDEEATLADQCARALCILSKSIGARSSMIQQGATEALVLVLQQTRSVETKKTCLEALCNLSMSGVACREGVNPDFGSCLPNGLVSAIVESLLPGSTITREIRCMSATLLFNHSCNARNREHMVVEGAVRAAVTLLKPTSVAVLQQQKNADALEMGASQHGNSRRSRRGSVFSISAAAPPVSLESAVGEDAFVLGITSKVLCNLSTVPQGCVAIVESGALSAMRQWWYWMTKPMHAATAGHLVYNATKSRGYNIKLADEGATLVLAAAIKTLYRVDDADMQQLCRRAVVALCRLTRLQTSAVKVVQQRGVEAMCNMIVAAANSGDTERRRSSFTPLALGSGQHAGERAVKKKILLHSYVERVAAMALLRLLWHDKTCDLATSQGAAAALRVLTTSRNEDTCRLSLMAICNALAHTHAARTIVDSGTLLHILARSAATPMLPGMRALVAQAAYNAACHSNNRSSLLGTPADSDTAIGSSTTSTPTTPGTPRTPGSPTRVNIQFASAATSSSSMPGATYIGLIVELLHWAFTTQEDAIAARRERRQQQQQQADGDVKSADSANSSSGSDSDEEEKEEEALQAAEELAECRTVATYCAAALRLLLAEPGADEEALEHGLVHMLVPALASIDEADGAPWLPVKCMVDFLYCLAHMSVCDLGRAHLVECQSIPVLVGVCDINKDSGFDQALEHERSKVPVPKMSDRLKQASLDVDPVAATRQKRMTSIFLRRLERNSTMLQHQQTLDPTNVGFQSKLALLKKLQVRVEAQPMLQQPQLAASESQLNQIMSANDVDADAIGVLPGDKKQKDGDDGDAGAPKLDLSGELARVQRLRVKATQMHAALARMSRMGRNAAALILCNLAAETHTQDEMCKHGVLAAWADLCSDLGDHLEDYTTQRITNALCDMSASPDMALQMTTTQVCRMLVAQTSSKQAAVRNKCIAALFNLSLLVGSEQGLTQSGAAHTLMVVALLRSHQSLSQRHAMQAIHNIMTTPTTRLQVLQPEVVFGIVRLAASLNHVTQRVCSLTLYCLAHDDSTRPLLVQHGVVKGIVQLLQRLRYIPRDELSGTHRGDLVMQAHQDALDNEEEADIARQRSALDAAAQGASNSAGNDARMCKMLTNVLLCICKYHEDEKQLVREGIVQVLVHLLQRFHREAEEVRSSKGSKSSHSKSSSVTTVEDEAGLGEMDETLYDPVALELSCSWALYRLLRGSSAAHEALQQAGGLDMLQQLLTSSQDTLAKLSLLGAAQVLWTNVGVLADEAAPASPLPILHVVLSDNDQLSHVAAATVHRIACSQHASVLRNTAVPCHTLLRLIDRHLSKPRDLVSSILHISSVMFAISSLANFLTAEHLPFVDTYMGAKSHPAGGWHSIAKLLALLTNHLDGLHSREHTHKHKLGGDALALWRVRALHTVEAACALLGAATAYHDVAMLNARQGLATSEMHQVLCQTVAATHLLPCTARLQLCNVVKHLLMHDNSRHELLLYSRGNIIRMLVVCVRTCVDVLALYRDQGQPRAAAAATEPAAASKGEHEHAEDMAVTGAVLQQAELLQEAEKLADEWVAMGSVVLHDNALDDVATFEQLLLELRDTAAYSLCLAVTDIPLESASLLLHTEAAAGLIPMTTATDAAPGINSMCYQALCSLSVASVPVDAAGKATGGGASGMASNNAIGALVTAITLDSEKRAAAAASPTHAGSKPGLEASAAGSSHLASSALLGSSSIAAELFPTSSFHSGLHLSEAASQTGGGGPSVAAAPAGASGAKPVRRKTSMVLASLYRYATSEVDGGDNSDRQAEEEKRGAGTKAEDSTTVLPVSFEKLLLVNEVPPPVQSVLPSTGSKSASIRSRGSASNIIKRSLTGSFIKRKKKLATATGEEDDDDLGPGIVQVTEEGSDDEDSQPNGATAGAVAGAGAGAGSGSGSGSGSGTRSRAGFSMRKASTRQRMRAAAATRTKSGWGALLGGGKATLATLSQRTHARLLATMALIASSKVKGAAEEAPPWPKVGQPVHSEPAAEPIQLPSPDKQELVPALCPPAQARRKSQSAASATRASSVASDTGDESDDGDSSDDEGWTGPDGRVHTAELPFQTGLDPSEWLQACAPDASSGYYGAAAGPGTPRQRGGRRSRVASPYTSPFSSPLSSPSRPGATAGFGAGSGAGAGAGAGSGSGTGAATEPVSSSTAEVLARKADRPAQWQAAWKSCHGYKWGGLSLQAGNAVHVEQHAHLHHDSGSEAAAAAAGEEDSGDGASSVNSESLKMLDLNHMLPPDTSSRSSTPGLQRPATATSMLARRRPSTTSARAGTGSSTTAWLARRYGSPMPQGAPGADSPVFGMPSQRALAFAWQPPEEAGELPSITPKGPVKYQLRRLAPPSPVTALDPEQHNTRRRSGYSQHAMRTRASSARVRRRPRTAGFTATDFGFPSSKGSNGAASATQGGRSDGFDEPGATPQPRRGARREHAATHTVAQPKRHGTAGDVAAAAALPRPHSTPAGGRRRRVYAASNRPPTGGSHRSTPAGSRAGRRSSKSRRRARARKAAALQHAIMQEQYFRADSMRSHPAASEPQNMWMRGDDTTEDDEDVPQAAAPGSPQPGGSQVRAKGASRARARARARRRTATAAARSRRSRSRARTAGGGWKVTADGQLVLPSQASPDAAAATRGSVQVVPMRPATSSSGRPKTSRSLMMSPLQRRARTTK